MNVKYYFFPPPPHHIIKIPTDQGILHTSYKAVSTSALYNTDLKSHLIRPRSSLGRPTSTLDSKLDNVYDNISSEDIHHHAHDERICIAAL